MKTILSVIILACTYFAIGDMTVSVGGTIVKSHHSQISQ